MVEAGLQKAARFGPATMDGVWSAIPFCALASVFIYPFYKRQPLGLLLALVGLLVAVLPRFAPVLGRGLSYVEESRSSVFLVTTVAAAIMARMPLIVFPFAPAAGDNAIYLHAAQRIAAGVGYGDYIVYPPGQSFWLALWIWFFGLNFHVLVTAQCLLSVVSVILTYLAFSRHSRRAGVWSALVLALYPAIVVWSGSLGHETTVIFLCSLLLLLISSPTFEQRPSLWVAYGIVAGAGALVRPTMLICPALLTLAYLTRVRSIRKSGMLLLTTALAMGATIAPWTVRNYYRYHEFCLISSNLGGVLLSANHPDSDGNYMAINGIGSGGSLIEQDHVYAQLAWRSIVSNPVRLLKRAAVRVIVQWGGETSIIDSVFGTAPPFGQTLRQLLRALAQASWAGFVSMWCMSAWRRKNSTHYCELPVVWGMSLAVFIFLLHTVTEPIARHHLPVLPIAAAIALPGYTAWVRSTLNQVAVDSDKNRRSVWC
jgi:4-amino-4-deoxy-L-arabinose transferase-like glycosyltransferase